MNWFHDDNFRTIPNTDGSITWSDNRGGGGGGLHLAQFYGHTLYRQRALRTLQDGKMKTSIVGDWNYYPPRLSDIVIDYPNFEMWTPSGNPGPGSIEARANKTNDNVNLKKYFAMGDPRFNIHPGHIIWTSIALYIHNKACDLISSEEPTFGDEDIFQRARVIVFHIIQKIRLQDFVSDSVSHTRDYVQIPYNPNELRDVVIQSLYFSYRKYASIISTGL